MGNVYFIGDLHFGHTGITAFRKEFPSEAVHSEYIKTCWNKIVSKKDLVFVMGDAAFSAHALSQVKGLAGRKILVRGNHDTLPTEDYLEHFEEVYGLLAYKEFWLSHAPIHPTELYGRTNIHGHCHRGGPTEIVTNSDMFRNIPVGVKAGYFNTCAEHLPTPYHPVPLIEVRDIMAKRFRE